MSDLANLSAILTSLASAAHALAEAARDLRAQPRVVPGAAPSLSPITSPPVAQCINEFLLSKARTGRSDRYLRQLRVSLSSMARGREAVPMDQVTARDLEEWTEARGWSPRTRVGYVSDVSTLFAWCIRRGYARENPAAAVDRPLPNPKPPGIHTPDQVREALARALDLDVGAARLLAIRYFAGVRSAEALRLQERDLAGGFVRIEAAAAKTRRRRLVAIQPNLAAWLALEGGPLPISDKRMRRVTGGWPQNCTRHSFVSYRLAATESASKVALEAGHAEAVLFAHYRELVTPAAASDYWSIRPPGATLQDSI